MLHTYRYCAIEAGSLDGRSGVQAVSGLCWVTQFALSPSGLHFTNWYMADVGAPGHGRMDRGRQTSDERSSRWIFTTNRRRWTVTYEPVFSDRYINEGHTLFTLFIVCLRVYIIVNYS